MARILVTTENHTHPDQTRSDEQCTKRGDVISIHDDGHIFGTKETLPTFVIVDVPGLTREQIKNYIDTWRRSIDYEILNTNAGQDGARIRAFSSLPGAANEYGITQAMVENYLTGWNASIFSTAQNQVVFDVTIKQLYTSTNFWGVSPALVGVVITETDYTQSTGNHIATIDATNATIPLKKIRGAIDGSGGIITDITGEVATVIFNRAVVRQEFFEHVNSQFQRIARMRRYFFLDADVTIAENAGGVIEITQAQLTNKIQDKAA